MKWAYYCQNCQCFVCYTFSSAPIGPLYCEACGIEEDREQENEDE